jgi:hypothetical protein
MSVVRGQIMADDENTRKAANLLAWRKSGRGQAWVIGHNGHWNHNDWTRLLDDLRASDFWPLAPDAIGESLEEWKRTYDATPLRLFANAPWAMTKYVLRKAMRPFHGPGGDSGSAPAPAEPSIVTGRKAFITTVIALVVSPLSLLLGYWLNHALQRPTWQSEYTDTSVYSNSGKPDPGVLKNAMANSLLRLWLRQEVERIAAMQKSEPCTDWLDGKPLAPRCIGDLRRAADSVLRIADSERNAARENLKRIREKTWKDKGIVQMMSVRAELLAIDPEKLAALLTGQLAQLEDLVSQLGPLVTALENADTSSERTGYVEFKVGVLNTGDSDGVIYRDAKVVWGSRSLPVSADTYTVVKAHSFNEITFGLGSDENSEDLRAFRQAVIAHQEVSCYVVLLSGKTSVTCEKCIIPQ